EFCLYHPECGYYTTTEKIFGSEGDYYTSPYTHQLFAYSLVDAFIHYFELLSQPSPFHLVELGVGEGFLGRDILTRLQDRHPEVFDVVVYCPVELGVDPPNRIQGVVFSNEFFDALPVHRIRMSGSEIKEIYVHVGEKISEMEGEVSDPRILEYMRTGFKEWRDNYQYEVNLRMVEVMHDLDQRIDFAIVLTVDYGYNWKEYQAVDRSKGTLLCYHRHQVVTDPYLNLGQQDITAHVNFEVMSKTGEELGWKSEPLTTQRQFLHKWGLEQRLMEEEAQGLLNPARVEERLGLKFLLVPGGISDTMKVLVQHVRV
ncbi:SAM-dependent methyltransferase, partial [Acidobacteria bacterium AH-259-D05]|nr:SAM-dependent methyltransferase [Acidobacteria bacterium AH-259-D05]